MQHVYQNVFFLSVEFWITYLKNEFNQSKLPEIPKNVSQHLLQKNGKIWLLWNFSGFISVCKISTSLTPGYSYSTIFCWKYFGRYKKGMKNVKVENCCVSRFMAFPIVPSVKRSADTRARSHFPFSFHMLLCFLFMFCSIGLKKMRHWGLRHMSIFHLCYDNFFEWPPVKWINEYEWR